LDFIKSDTLTPAQYDYIVEVSELCPNEYGDGVYLSRAIRSVYENVRYSSAEDCYSGRIEQRSVRDKLLTDRLSIYPNPAKDEVNIVIEIPKNEKGELSIVNLQGQTITSYKVNVNRNSVKINAKQLKSGIYIVKYISDMGIQSIEKLIIDK